ncbi:Hypothetical protein (plasmid) [Pseudomonas putida]|nr:Hypothetical protein [Pseudomonas putida]
MVVSMVTLSCMSVFVISMHQDDVLYHHRAFPENLDQV